MGKGKHLCQCIQIGFQIASLVTFITTSPVYSIDVNHTNDLKEGYDEQRHGAHVAVENLQPVVSRAQSKDEGHRKGGEANQPCR